MVSTREVEGLALSNKHKHLEFIQSAISRLAQNSFLIKGWSIISVSAILAIAFRQTSSAAALIALLPTLMFWALDSYFLAIERRYRNLYEKVRVMAEDQIDYSMSYGSERAMAKDVFDCMWNFSNALQYPTIIAVLVVTSAIF